MTVPDARADTMSVSELHTTAKELPIAKAGQSYAPGNTLVDLGGTDTEHAELTDEIKSSAMLALPGSAARKTARSSTTV